MSTAPSTSTSQSNFVPIFNAALESYERKTKKDLTSHPLLSSLQSCGSPEAVLTVFRDQIPAFNQSRNRDDGLTKWVIPTVNVLYTFSAAVGQGVGLVNIITLLSRREFLFLTSIFRHSHPQMQFSLGSAFSSWSVYLIVACATYFDNGGPRRLKMPVLAKTSSSRFLITLNDSFIGLIYTLGSHQLRR